MVFIELFTFRQQSGIKHTGETKTTCTCGMHLLHSYCTFILSDCQLRVAVVYLRILVYIFVYTY